ncbi:IPT/TIG domain-containing protein [Nocardia sp. 004]|uniref:IPT/TIG domain-containing protein n=1 Tax=Nocardia sp. 004 TaxID=3385978 RepID=UPI0039A2898C
MPTITAIFPTSGPPSGGNFVVITGTDFVGPTTVRFGGTATTFVQDNPAQITALAPPGSGTVLVTVTNSTGVSNGVPYTYGVPAVPTLTGLVPTSGPEAGGTVVVLTGTGLLGATAVTFGGTPAAAFTVNSATTITATAPPGVGAVGVTVTTAGGTSNALAYTYIPLAPTLVSVTPATGPAIGGNAVSIIGTNFTGATSVTFGVTPALVFAVVNDSLITATVPPGAGTVGVTVTTAGGTSNPVLYTYLPAPSVVVIGPIGGPMAGGTPVLISGSGFTGATSVAFGAAPAAFVVNSDSSISAVSPPNPPGPAVVSVTTPGGVGGGPVFTYV